MREAQHGQKSLKRSGSQHLALGILCGATPLLMMWILSAAGISRLPSFVIGYGCAGFPFVWLWCHYDKFPRDKRALVATLATAALCRLILLGIEPILSEDIWRYIWDGLVVNHGLNPYQAAPLDPYYNDFTFTNSLDWLRSKIGHAHIPTVYPPAAEITFAITSFIDASPLPFRALCIGADLVSTWALWHTLHLRGLNPQRALLFAFCPLSIVETSVGSHIEPIGIACLMVGVYCLQRGFHRSAAMGIAWATATKLAPALILIPLMLSRRKVALMCLLIIVLGCGSFCLYYEAIPQGLSAYAQRWRANDGIFAVVHNIFEIIWPSDGGAIPMPSFIAHFVDTVVGQSPGGPIGTVWSNELVLSLTKVVCGAAVIGTIVWSINYRLPVIESWLCMMTVLLLCSPVVHPWYILWVLPFAILCLSNSNSAIAILVLVWSLTSWLAYWAKVSFEANGTWNESNCIKLLEYSPLCVTWVIVTIKRRLGPPTKLKTG